MLQEQEGRAPSVDTKHHLQQGPVRLLQSSASTPVQHIRSRSNQAAVRFSKALLANCGPLNSTGNDKTCDDVWLWETHPRVLRKAGAKLFLASPKKRTSQCVLILVLILFVFRLFWRMTVTVNCNYQDMLTTACKSFRNSWGFFTEKTQGLQQHKGLVNDDRILI